MKRIFNTIDHNFRSYVPSRFTIILIELLLYKYNFFAYCLKLEIKDGKLIPLKRLDPIIAGRSFTRRGESMIKLISDMLKEMPLPNGIFYVCIDDKYLFYDVPIFTYAKPPSKKGLLIPDHTFIDAEPENMAIQKYVSITTIQEKMNQVNEQFSINYKSPRRIANVFDGDGTNVFDGDGTNENLKPKQQNQTRSLTRRPRSPKSPRSPKEKKHKIKELFFIGQNISLVSNNTNIRSFLRNQPKPFNVMLDKYMPMAEFCNYAYLLNLSGAWSWSFRFKFLFLTNSLVINVGCFWVQIFDALFIPGIDYINIIVDSKNNNFTNIKNEILNAVVQNDIKAITKSGYKRGKLMTMKNINSVLHYCIYTWINKFIIDYNNHRDYNSNYNSNNNNNYYIKQFKLSLNNMDAYREIKFYDTIEKAGKAHLFIPLINCAIKDDILYCSYVNVEMARLRSIPKPIQARITEIINVIKSLGITINESSAHDSKNILVWNGQYYLSNFKKYICPEDINI